MESQRVMGIDPGLSNTGWAVIDTRAGEARLVDCGNITTPKELDHATRLHQIHRALQEQVEAYQPQAVSIETLYFARNLKSAMVVAQARGVAILASTSNGAPCFEYTPLQIKQAVVGYGAATKEQVKKMVQAIVGMPSKPGSNHAADAIAAAICHANFAKIH